MEKSTSNGPSTDDSPTDKVVIIDTANDTISAASDMVEDGFNMIESISTDTENSSSFVCTYVHQIFVRTHL